jgi:hypothetical protein
MRGSDRKAIDSLVKSSTRSAEKEGGDGEAMHARMSADVKGYARQLDEVADFDWADVRGSFDGTPFRDIVGVDVVDGETIVLVKRLYRSMSCASARVRPTGRGQWTGGLD